MNFKVPTLYKRLLAFVAVIGPIFWLVFTEDGQRRTDTVVLTLWGEDEIKLNLQALDNQVTEEEFMKVFPDIEWQCQDQVSPFGNRLCASKIGVFNGIPAHYVTVFFHDKWVNGVKVGYRKKYHTQLKTQLWQQMGSPIPEGTDQPRVKRGPDSVLHWSTNTGHVILKEELAENEEPSLMWLPFSMLPNSSS
ncbi:MAG: hypothetical protein N0E50_16870 [Candidatus Thiodiazotropha taylori]|nr:hypothetical protein [Candidatus Thiodiazotropha taylori]